VLEHDTDSLTDRERSRYAYFRGMTDYRLGFREDARYWLGIAQAAEKQFPGGLNEDEQARLQKTLGDLNKDVFGVAPDFEDSASKATERSTLPDGDAEPEDGMAPGGSGGDVSPVEAERSPGESTSDDSGSAP
jgi:hypothetical protein